MGVSMHHRAVLPGFFAVLLLSLLTSCDERAKQAIAEAAKWRTQLAEAQKQIAELNNTFKELGQNMAEAADKIDPLNIKTLFQKNVELTEANNALKLLLANKAAGGVLFLDSEQLVLRIDSFKGDVQVIGWVDNESNTFANIRLRQASDTSSLEKNWCLDFVKKQAPCGSIGCCVDFGTMSVMDDQWKKPITDFTKASVYAVSCAGTDEHKCKIYLRDILLRGGVHLIWLDVKPSTPVWSVATRLVKLDQSGNQQTLKAFDFGSDVERADKGRDSYSISVKYKD